MTHPWPSVLINDCLASALWFVLNLSVIDEKYKDNCLTGVNDEEKDLEEILKELASDMNISGYLIPVFNPGANVKALLQWNDIA